MFFLNVNEELRKMFSPGPMVSFQSAWKLSSSFVTAKLYPLQKKVGFSKCGKRRCKVCNSITVTTIFISAVAKDTFKITHSLNCDNKCLINLMPVHNASNNTQVKLQIKES